MKRPFRFILVVAATTGLGTPAPAQLPFGINMAVGLQRRLLLKLGETLIDAITRQTLSAATMPAEREEYQLVDTPCYYEDVVSGTYRGTPMGFRIRRMWLDPVTRSQHFNTYVDGVLQDREAFEYTLHNRNYRCEVPGPAGYDLRIRARTFYWLEHRVTREAPEHAVNEHYVQWVACLTTLPDGCTDTRLPRDMVETGAATLPRGGRVTVSPTTANADISKILLMYDEK